MILPSALLLLPLLLLPSALATAGSFRIAGTFSASRTGVATVADCEASAASVESRSRSTLPRVVAFSWRPERGGECRHFGAAALLGGAANPLRPSATWRSAILRLDGVRLLASAASRSPVARGAMALSACRSLGHAFYEHETQPGGGGPGACRTHYLAHVLAFPTNPFFVTSPTVTTVVGSGEAATNACPFPLKFKYGNGCVCVDGASCGTYPDPSPPSSTEALVVTSSFDGGFMVPEIIPLGDALGDTGNVASGETERETERETETEREADGVADGVADGATAGKEEKTKVRGSSVQMDIKVDASVGFQEILGFGGAITDAVAYVYPWFTLDTMYCRLGRVTPLSAASPPATNTHYVSRSSLHESSAFPPHSIHVPSAFPPHPLFFCSQVLLREAPHGAPE